MIKSSGAVRLYGSMATGLNNAGTNNVDWVVRCGNWASWADKFVLRVSMGSVMDYYRPVNGATLCGELV